jgi:hypothetical protein
LVVSPALADVEENAADALAEEYIPDFLGGHAFSY